MTDHQQERIVRQANGLLKKCLELDRAMVLSKKADQDLTQEEANELIRLERKIRRWCLPRIK